MDNLLALLLQARNVSHVHHWKVKSFAQHLAFGELYNSIETFSDELAELAMGDGIQLGNIEHDSPTGFDKTNPLHFIVQLHQTLEDLKPTIPQKDWFINKYEELQASVAQIKYKLENLS
jgi:hypothetical protein